MTATAVKQMAGSPYSQCRLNQFNAPGGMGIPDGKNVKFLVVDTFAADNIVTTSENGFVIRTFPFMPYSAGIQGLGPAGQQDFQINGVPFTNQTPIGMGIPSFYPCGQPAEWASINFNVGGFTQDPYQSSNMRLVGCTRRLFYTSPAISAQGLISVTPSHVGVEQYGIVTNPLAAPVANTTAMSVNKPDNTLAYSAPPNTQLLSVDMAQINPAVFTRDTFTARVADGCQIIHKHIGEDHLVRPTSNNVFGANAFNRITSTTGIVLPSLFTATNNTSGGGIAWWDDSWEQVDIFVTGAIEGATFRFETALCFEVNPVATSTLASMTKRKSHHIPGHTKVVDDKVNSQATATISQGAKTVRGT